MSSDFLTVLGCAIFGLLGHVAIKKRWAEWLLRTVMALTFGGEAAYIAGLSNEDRFNHWNFDVTYGSCAFTGFLLVRQFRRIVSAVLTTIDLFFSKSAWIAAFRNWKDLRTVFVDERIFVATSIPHMVALFVYVQTIAYLLGVMNPLDFALPGMPLPLPVQIDQLLSYNGIGLVLLSFCGVGIFVTRPFKEVLRRLAIVKPTKLQVAIGIGLIVMSFFYDYVWSLYTQNHSGLGGMLSTYNSGTFSVMGGVMPSVVLALATALFAGIGEETLIRGALQPVFGILPAAIMHGILHGQFAHAPIFMVQVAGWSMLMGLVKRYTNTSTTIIGHAGFNFCTTFLFAFNP